jgi:hypothetical protein
LSIPIHEAIPTTGVTNRIPFVPWDPSRVGHRGVAWRRWAMWGAYREETLTIGSWSTTVMRPTEQRLPKPYEEESVYDNSGGDRQSL